MTSSPRIPLSSPTLVGTEIEQLVNLVKAGKLGGPGEYAHRCEQAIEELVGVTCRALLVHSCTAALEIAALLARVGPGDEVIMPSYTFSSTANAFALRGAVPVFIDIREDTKNMDERLIEGALTSRTKAIVPVHYAGVACEMDTILAIAREAQLLVVEDAAQGICSSYRGRALGSIGDLGTLSFHQTKNIIAGEGGALLVNREDMVGAAEVIREKGTDRRRFDRGEVETYTWVDIGSSYAPSELIAAFLESQLLGARTITLQRLVRWQRYHDQLQELEKRGLIAQPQVPGECAHNGHLYSILLRDGPPRDEVIRRLRAEGVEAAIHFVPLHLSPAGRRIGRCAGDLAVTERVFANLIRLPLSAAISLEDQGRVCDALTRAVSG